MKTTITSRAKVLTSLLSVSLVAIAAAGCSSSSSSNSSPTAAQSGISASGASQTSLKPLTIGVLPVIGTGSEVLTQAIASLRQGASQLGFTVDVIDPAGDPQKIQSAMSTFVAKKVNAIFTLALDPSQLGPGLAQAKAAHIPVVAVNNQPDPATASQFTAVIAPTEDQFGTVLGNYMKASLPPGQVLEEINPDYTGYETVDAAMSIASGAGFSVQKKSNFDLANLAGSIEAITREGLQSSPNTKYVITGGDPIPSLIYPVMKQINRTDVTILGRYDDQSTLNILRSGGKVVVVATDLYTPSLLALDELAANDAHGTALHSILGGSDFPMKIITSSNYPKSGYNYTLSSTIASFASKWSSEYGTK